MSDRPQLSPAAPGPDPVDELRPPASEVGVIGWLNHNLFSSKVSGLVTIVLGLIVAAVLGVVLTMGKINEPPEVLGHSIGAALVLNLFITFAIPGISIGGHLGGAIAGAICGAVMLAPAYRRGPAWTIWATPVAVGVGSVVAVIMIVNAA